MMAAALAEFKRSLEGKDAAAIADIAADLFCANKTLTIKLNEFQNTSTQMSIQYQQLQDELNSIRAEKAELLKQIEHLTGVRVIQTNELFGRSTECTEDIIDVVINDDLPSDSPLSEDALPEEDEQENRRRAKNVVPLFGDVDKPRKKQRRKRMDTSELPIQDWFDYDINELNRKYGEGNWRFSYWTQEDKVYVIRRTTYVKRTHRPIVSVGLEHVLFRPDRVEPLIPKSKASPSLVALIMTDWIQLHLPLYRQEQDPNRFGFSLSRQTMSHWIIYVTLTHLKPVYLYLSQMMMECRFQQCDETYYSVIKDGREAGSKSFIWVHRSSELLDCHAMVVYCYDKSRSADHLRDFFANIADFVYLTCDAYSAYPCFADETNGLMTLTGCSMHCRRQFVNALLVLHLKDMTDEQIQNLPEVQAILLYREIYLAENSLKDLSASERHDRRQTEVLPRVNAFFDFVRSLDTSDPLMTEKLKDAIRYALNHEDSLRMFLTDGNIPLDNGACERSIRPVALYRRNSLFSYTVTGAEVCMMLFTLIETAKVNNADPYLYLKYLMEEMPQYLYATEQNHLPDMMPWSEQYRSYEIHEQQHPIWLQAPPGNEKPRTPTKGTRRKISA